MASIDSGQFDIVRELLLSRFIMRKLFGKLDGFAKQPKSEILIGALFIPLCLYAE